MLINKDTTEQLNSIPVKNSLWLRAGLIFMFLLASLIRMDEIQVPGHLIEREYNSAIFAHAFYLTGNTKVEQWHKDIASAARDQLPVLEPPLTEYLVSLLYRAIGREEIWYSRYLTSLFWLIGGIFLYKTVRILDSIDAALIALGYYLLLPWGIIISRSFQPDSLMMMMFLLSLYAMVLYFKRSSRKRLLLLGTLSGLTLLLRPLVLFTLFGAMVALSIHEKRSWGFIVDKKFIVFIFMSLIFPLAFYGYGIYFAGFLQGQVNLSFRPYLLSRLNFWEGWFELGARVVEHSFLLLATLGFFVLRNSFTRFLVVGLTTGYFIFGTIFTFHVHTHPYYHIQAIPIIAICASPLLAMVFTSLRKAAGQNWWIPVALCLLAVSYFSWREVRNSIYTVKFEDPNLAREVGNVVRHSPHTVFVAAHYGVPLEYYGELAGAPWPVKIDDPFYRRPDARELTVQERIDGLGFTPEYFVITNFDLYRKKHQDLKTYLEHTCSARVEAIDYLIYSQCQTLSMH